MPRGNKYRSAVLLPVRKDWNRQAERWGLGLPGWFRAQLREIDPEWELQFVPPDSVDPEGVPQEIYPYGTWDICYRLPGSRMLNPKVVFSMADARGIPIPPTPALVRLLRRARNLHFRRESAVLRKVMAGALGALRRDQEGASRKVFDRRIADVTGILMKNERQWTNRVSLYRRSRSEAVH